MKANQLHILFKSIFFSFALGTLSFSLYAMDLQQAKQQGYLGEQTDGYLGVVKQSPEAQKVMIEINAKRRAAYEVLAKQNGVSVQQVGALAGKKAIEKTSSGMFVQDASGKWVQK